MARIGIGTQVVVRAASADDAAPWPEEPSGVVVRAGGSALAGVWGGGARGRMWWVEFDGPQQRSDGAGPFMSAQVHEKYLEAAPEVGGV